MTQRNQKTASESPRQGTKRQERLRVTPSPGPKNSLQYIWRWVNPFRVIFNFLIIHLGGRFMPSMALKRWLYQRTGMQLGSHVSLALMCMIDPFFPHYIKIGANTIIGYNTTILAHEFMLDGWRVGPVEVGQDVVIGANCTILPGVIIGDGAIISAMSLVNHDVPPGAVVGGIPARPLRTAAETLTPEGGMEATQ